MAKKKKSTPRRTSFAATVSKNISKRAHQYAVRSTYKKNGGLW